jgi:hypothetical protein
MPVAMLLTVQTISLTLTAGIMGLQGILKVHGTALFVFGPHLSQWQQFDAFQVKIMLMPRFLGLDLGDNLLQFVSQGIDLVLHQLCEKPPFIFLWYTLYQVIGVLLFSMVQPPPIGPSALSQRLISFTYRWKLNA